jgi:diacylglycerol kinase family enzyme
MHLFVINPKSFDDNRRGLERIVSSISSVFKKAGSEDYFIHVSRFPRDAVSLIRSFIAGARKTTTVRVYAVGGDGILFDCLNGVMGFDNAELAAVPYGRTNNFIRGFGPRYLRLFRDIPLQIAAPTIPLDVMSTGNLYAINFCLVGIEAEAAVRSQGLQEYLAKGSFLARWLGRRFYEQLYYLGALPAIFNRERRTQRYEITLDGEDYSGSYRGVKIANGCWYGGMKSPIRSARPEDGMLDVLLARSAGPLRTLALVPFYITGKYRRFSGDFIFRRGRKLTIRSDSPLAINFDDITSFDSALSIELLPRAVNFVDPGGRGYVGYG